MDISEVVRRSGLPASTLRFYEQKGLIASVGRRGLHRVFAAPGSSGNAWWKKPTSWINPSKK